MAENRSILYRYIMGKAKFRLLSALHVLVIMALVTLGGCRTVDSRHASTPSGQITEIRTRHGIPGLGVVALSSDEILYLETLGYRDIQTEDPFTGDDLFHLGSNTKAISVFIAAKLVEEGTLSWENLWRNGMAVSTHDGSAGTFYCHTVIVAELDLAVVVTANSADPSTVKGLYKIRNALIKHHIQGGRWQ